MRTLRCPRFIAMATAISTVALTVLTAVPAHAAQVQVLTVNRLGANGAPVAVGDSLTSGLAANSMFTLSTVPGGPVGLSCPTSAITAVDQTNPVVQGPATATLQLTQWTIGPAGPVPCASTIPGVVAVNGVKVINLPDPTTVSDAAGLPIQIGPGAVLQIKVTETLNNGMGMLCTYTPVNGIINGNVTPNTSQWVFANQPFTVAPPVAACGGVNAFLSASFNPVVDANQLNGPVFVN